MGQKTGHRPATWLGKVVALATLAIAVLAAHWLSRSSKPHQNREPGMIRFLPVASDFGEVWETDAFRWEFVLQNSGDREVVVRGVRAGCGCSRLERSDEVRLQPGDQARYPVVVDLRKIRTSDSSEVRPAEISMDGEVGPVEGRYLPFRASASGRVRRLLNCTPHEVGLGEELTCAEPGRQLEFRLQPTRSLLEPRIKRLPKGWSAKLDLPEKGQPCYVLRATPIKNEPGVFVDEIEMEVVAEDGRVIPTQSIKVMGRVTELIQVLPRCPDLGEMRVGTKGRTTLWVSRKDRDPIEEVEVVSGNRALKSLGAYREGEVWRIDLECTSDDVGARSATGTVRVKSRRVPDGKAGFEVRWYGTRE